MKIVMFYHSLVSDWNHGNAHFLRGVVSELISRGHDVQVYEPRDSWSAANLRAEFGERPVLEFQRIYGGLQSISYDLESLDLDRVLDGVDLVIAHEWNEHELVRRLGAQRKSGGGWRLLFHDTHHRSVTDPKSIANYDLRYFDGVLAYGKVIRDLYLANGWSRKAWTWHEAADTRVFRPLEGREVEGDVVWIGNWGDGERTRELEEFLIEPVKSLKIKALAYGVRYPKEGIDAISRAGIRYAGWLPNYRVPEVFSSFLATVHIPRRPYVKLLPGIPTIRPFEALACGIPLVCSPWEDAEHLFTPGKDFLVARDGNEMKRHLATLLHDGSAARELKEHGLRTILERHTCMHRVDELLAICGELGLDAVGGISKQAPLQQRSEACSSR